MVAFSGLTEFQAACLGERSPDSGNGFQNWDDRIHVGGSGCITQPRGIPRHLQKVHVQHTWDAYAGRAGTLWPLGSVPGELPEPQVHSHFADWAQS